MLNDYISNFESILSIALFVIFKVTIIVFTFLLIFSLIALATGCLIKSQKIKSKFLIASPVLLLGIVFLLILPIIFIRFKY